MLHLYFFYHSISSSGNGDVSTLITHIVATVEDLSNNLVFNAQIIGLNPVFKYEKKQIVLLKFGFKFVL